MRFILKERYYITSRVFGRFTKVSLVNGSTNILATALLILFCAGWVTAKPWRGIIPLQTSRVEVEKIFGKKSSDRSATVTYHLRREKVIVTYSAGSCNTNGPDNWNVPTDVVVSLTVFPKKVIYLTDLSENFSTFEKFSGPKDLPGTFEYYNADDGMSVDVDSRTWSGKESVMNIAYFPPARQHNLRCR